MRSLCAVCVLLLSAAAPLAAQSLFVPVGERALSVGAGWSVGPVSQGIETEASVSLGGRWDVAFGLHRYVADFGGPEDTAFVEWAPMVRYLLLKEGDDQVPATLALRGQFVQSRLDGEHEGWYALGGAELYKRLELSDGLALYPFVGFSLAGESDRVGGLRTERAVYLTRHFGVHGLVAIGPASWLRLTVEEQSFRRETFRALRASYVQRF